MPDQMQDPGENASFEARQAYAQWNLERKAEARQFIKEMSPEQEQLASVFQRAERQRDIDASGQGRVTSEASEGQGRVTSEAPSGQQDQGGILQELQKQTELLTQILAKLGPATFS